MTPEQEKLIRDAAAGNHTWHSVRAIAEVLLDLDDRIKGHAAIDSINKQRREVQDAPLSKAEPIDAAYFHKGYIREPINAPTGHFGCVGSVCQLGNLTNTGCSGRCLLETLEERGTVARPTVAPDDAQANAETRARARDRLIAIIGAYLDIEPSKSANVSLSGLLDDLLNELTNMWDDKYGFPHSFFEQIKYGTI